MNNNEAIEYMVRNLVKDRAAEAKNPVMRLSARDRVRVNVADAYLPRHSLKGIFVDATS